MAALPNLLRLQRLTPEPLKVDTQAPRHRRQAPRAALELRPESIRREEPLIGRESELARLYAALQKASRGQGHVVAIVGEAGIGKSSVLLALAAEAYARGVRSLLGRSYQSEQVLAFGTWVEAFRSGHVVEALDVVEGLTPHWRGELARFVPELGGEGHDPTPGHRTACVCSRLRPSFCATSPGRNRSWSCSRTCIGPTR